MRTHLVDYARTRGSQKRGGGVPKVTLDEELMALSRERARPGRAGRRAQSLGPHRSSEVQGDRVALLWRSERR